MINLISSLTPRENFLSTYPGRTSIKTSALSEIEFSDGPTDGNSLIITPYKIPDNKVLRDTSWHYEESINLRSFACIDLVVSKLSKYDKIYIAGAFETLNDIRPLLKSLRIWLTRDSNREVVVYNSAPKRANLLFRSWDDIYQIADVLKLSGFEVSIVGNEVHAKCSDDYYDKFLESRGLPKKNIKHIVCTTEHPDYSVTGGIGSYVKESSKLYGSDSTVLIIERDGDEISGLIANNRWLSVNTLIGKRAYSELFKYDFSNSSSALLECIYQTLLYYDNIEFIEGSDYGGMNLFRVIQAKKTGLLPDNLNTITVCHGSNIYVDNAASRYPSKNNIPVIQKEVYSVINSDVTIFLTNFVNKLYKSYGIEAINPVRSRLPIDLHYYYKMGITMPAGFKEVRNIFYIGKLSNMKGCDYFLKAIIEIAKTGKEYKVFCASSHNSPDAQIDKLLKKVNGLKNIKLSIDSFNRDELIKELNLRSIDSVAIIPYPGDNHPNVILELMLTGMDFVASNSGGIPELIPLKDSFITELNCETITKKFYSITSNREERYSICSKNRDLYIAQQKIINKGYSIKNLESYLPSVTRTKPQSVSKQGYKISSLGVIVQCYNTDLKYIEELCESLSNQSLLPDMVIFVNDGSTIRNYEEDLTRLLDAKLNTMPHRVITQDNRGLASARNCGLMNLNTEYILTIDSDDVIDNYYIENMFGAINKDKSKKLIAVTPYLNVFSDGLDCTRTESFHDQYMPYGSNLGTAFFPNNTYGSSAAIFNRNKLIKATGGWDDTSKATYEDWALYIRLNSLGYTFNILPLANYFYRVRRSSMLRTYNPRDGHLRLMSNYLNIPKYDAYLLFSQLFEYYNNSPDYNHKLNQQMTQDILHLTFGTYDTPHISKLVKVSKLFRIYDDKMPTPIKLSIAKILGLVSKVLGKIRSKLK